MAYNPTNTIKPEVNESERQESKPVKAFLASVDKVLKSADDFLKLEKEDDKDGCPKIIYVSTYRI